MFDTIYGVDFSGAKLAGRNLWLATLRRDDAGWHLAALNPLEKLAGTAERGPVLEHLVGLVRASDRALWAMDFSFGFPVEVIDEGTRWEDQFTLLNAFGDDAYGVGLECLRRAVERGGPTHVRRLTELEERAPLDSYHYRLIYQTFFGMRDVLGPLRADPATAILPFHYRRLPRARRVVVEALPARTLVRLGLPHQNYKQPEGGPLTRVRLRSRRLIVPGLAAAVSIGDTDRRRMTRNPGGDAIDAVAAGVGGLQSWGLTDHDAVRRDRRYRREGKTYA
ncbi:MAG: DUF429 domain-containing protein [Gemmataceae bacterium]